MPTRALPRAGFTVIEVAVSLAIMSLILVGTVTLIIKASESQRSAMTMTSLQNTAISVYEAIRDESITATDMATLSNGVKITGADGKITAFTLSDGVLTRTVTDAGGTVVTAPLTPDFQTVTCVSAPCFSLENTSNARLMTVHGLTITPVSTSTLLEQVVSGSPVYKVPELTLQLPSGSTFL